MRHRPLLAIGFAAGLLQPGLVQAQIRNAPPPRALEFAAYIFAASNVCGYRIGTDQFEALLEKQGVKAADVGPRGPFGGKVQTIFALMSNQMQINRERSCLAVAGEYGPDGNVVKNVLLPASAEGAPADAAPSAETRPPVETKPAETRPAETKPAQ